MQLVNRSVVICAIVGALVSGCGSSSYNSTRGTSTVQNSVPTGTAGNIGNGNPAPTGGNGITGALDSLIATSSVGGVVSVAAGSTQTISITFTSSDGLVITGFGVSGNLGTLPAGWSGPGSFSCASVSVGNGCVLNLSYSPSSVASGTLTLDCVFVDNATMPRTPGTCVTIQYAATAANNVLASTSQTGQINAVVGAGKVPVTVTFTTDNGAAATDLSVTTALGSLPAGWSTTAASLSCAIISTGSGCQLPLNFQPSGSARGILVIDYAFTDESGTAKTGTLNIPYSSATVGDVVANASPAGQINAVRMTGGQAVAVTFTTDDGKAVKNLQLATDLAHLPAGWHSALTGFSCAAASTGNGCQLPLIYAPTVLNTGTLTLNYVYEDARGAERSGLLNLPYAATTDDNVMGTASPSGQINAVVGMGTQTVLVTFTTDDSRTSTALDIANSLTTLPAGWTAAGSSFACSGLSTGSTCQLSLAYAPSAADSGMLALSYGYINNAGVTKSGTVNIPYRATTDDNVVGTPSISTVAVASGSTTTLDVVFTTDDGNPATLLAITSGLTTLPAGWSSASGTFGCSAVSVGIGCKLSLVYAPTAADAGTLSLGFSYLNDSGIAKTATASIVYSATP
jgi:hypothetical protein